MGNRSSSDSKLDQFDLSGPQRVSVALVVRLFVSCCLVLPPLISGGLSRSVPDPDPYQILTGRDAVAVATHFAPRLFFHPSERYFPCSPIFPVEQDAEGQQSILNRLGDPESRRQLYLDLPLEEKAKLARVYYRVRTVRNGSEDRWIIDYWLYYVWNDYRVRGGLFPFWFDRSHPNDLEHIHLILKKRSDSEREAEDSPIPERFILEAVFSSAHEGTMPANRLYPEGEEASGNPHFLVELGAHAIAPDANRDGLYRPGKDGHSGYKILWGIRDDGITWTRYHPSYAHPRSEDEAILLSPRAGEYVDGELSYQLVSADDLTDQMSQLDLDPKQHREVFETRVHWIKRFLGTSNGESHRLVEPPDRKGQGHELGLNGFSSTERGLLLGGTSLADAPGIFLGGRYGFLHGINYLPDLIFQLDGILTTRGKGLLSSQFFLAYPISVATKVMGGAGLLTDTIDFKNRQWDWLAGLEVRLGHLQVYAGFRSSGSVNDETIDIRLAYFF